MIMTQEEFVEAYKNSVFYPPQYNSHFDNWSYILSKLAENKVAEIINSKTGLKVWGGDEGCLPDLFLINGYIEVGTVKEKDENINIWERKIKSFHKWDDKYGKKKIIVFFELETGKIYFHSFRRIVEIIEAKNPAVIKQVGGRGDWDIYYQIPKTIMKNDLTQIEAFFKE